MASAVSPVVSPRWDFFCQISGGCQRWLLWSHPLLPCFLLANHGGNWSTCKDRNVETSISTTLGKCPCGGAGGFYRTRSASRVMRESPQLQPLKGPEPIFISVKLRRLGAWGGLLAPMGHLQTLEAAEVRRFLPTTLLPVPALNVPRLLMASPPLPSLAAKGLPKLRPLQEGDLALNPTTVPLT